MASTGFIVALVFAAVFGSALIWLVLYYSHRYIHQQCLQLDHWFHLISPRETAATCCDQEKHLGCETCLGDRALSTTRERGRERSKKRYRNRGDEGHRVREASAAWITQPKMERPGRLLQMEAAAQNQWFGAPNHQQTPWQEQMPVPTQMPYPQPVAYPQMPAQGALPISMPVYAPQILKSPQATTMPESVNYPHHDQQARSQVRSDSARSKHPVVQTDRPAQRRKRSRGPDQVDYMHICDELPSVVRKGLKKSPIAAATTSSSSSSGDSSTTQEVPRAGPPAAEALPFPCPQYAYAAGGPYAPTACAKRWIDDGAEGRKSTFKVGRR